MKDDGRNDDDDDYDDDDDDDDDDRTWFLGLRVVGDGESSQRIHTHRVRPNTQKLWISSDNLKWVAMVGNDPNLAIFWYIFPEFPGLSKNWFRGGYPSLGSCSREYDCFKRNPFTIIHDVCVYYCMYIYICTHTHTNYIYILMKSSIFDVSSSAFSRLLSVSSAASASSSLVGPGSYSPRLGDSWWGSYNDNDSSWFCNIL